MQNPVEETDIHQTSHHFVETLRREAIWRVVSVASARHHRGECGVVQPDLASPSSSADDRLASMKRATITIPDELEARLDEYVRRQEVPPALTAVVQAALREFLEKRERPDREREVRPFRITPVAEKDDEGERDVSINHDKYFAEAAHKDSFNEK